MNEKNVHRKVPWLLLTTVVAAAALVALLIWPSAPKADPKVADIVVYKTATCGCCAKWVEHLQDAGFAVRVVNVRDTRSIQSRVGVPPRLGSCHTAVAGDYWVEGHVPADLIQKLLAEKPEGILGISVPGMPPGTPGMEGPYAVKYDIVAHDSSGRTSLYATRQGRSESQ